MFTRVPTKSLLRFKCVSKQWLCIISEPNFTLAHARCHQANGYLKPSALLLNNDYTRTPEFQVVPLNSENHGSKGDTLRFCRLFSSADYCNSVVNDKDCGHRYFICNPTTRQFKRFSFPCREFEERLISVNLAFDPLLSPYYKIIAIREQEELSGEFWINLYSSETDSWRFLGKNFHPPSGICFRTGVFFKGMVHWCSDEYYCEELPSYYFGLLVALVAICIW
ncbi:F-box protein At5g07610-like [Durio zibethinus]|uniref:F-box protein At5g07610-like n=1 Tax=Durio zibethinus TaxID=66656 RepID=A0A6P5YUC6_DURZI|nr:F-box protein At5g07610-like [Durio zibethinus]